LIIAVVTDDVVIEYPAEPTEVTWVPSIWRDAYRCIDEYSPAEIAVLAEATRRASLAASDSDQDDGTQ
jgi:hypothetical protein